MEFDVVFEKQKTGYTVYVPALPGCISEGDTKVEALKNIKEAISLYLEEKSKESIKRMVGSVSVQKACVKAYA